MSGMLLCLLYCFPYSQNMIALTLRKSTIIHSPVHSIFTFSSQLRAKKIDNDIKSSYYTISDTYIYTEEIKKSKFIVYVTSASNIEEGLKYLDKVKDDKASHNCWAYKSYDYERSSDDGEPTGTAGKPILQAIISENIVNCIVIVTRYFGGIKLGTGGLVRAYGSVAREALRQSSKIEAIRYVELNVMVPAELLGNLYQCIQSTSSSLNGQGSIHRLKEEFMQLDAKLFDVESSSECIDAVSLTLNCPVSCQNKLTQSLTDSCRGRVIIQV